MRRLLIVFLILTATVCCGRPGAVWEKLQCARQVMDEHPDSALSILQAIAYSSLTGDEEKALYGMLYVQALDKNQLDPANDSIISHSVEYYAAHKKLPEQIISTYYRGRALQDGKNYPKALVCFYKSKELAERNGDCFWAGMACRGIADVYNETVPSDEEVLFSEKGYGFLKKNGRQPYINYALYDYARALANTDDPLKVNRGIAMTEQLEDSAEKYQDIYLYYISKKVRGLSLMKIKRHREALVEMTYVCGTEYAKSEDSLYMSLALIENGKYAEAEELSDMVTGNNTKLKSLIHCKIERHNGNYKRAVEYVNLINGQSDSILRVSMNQALTASIADFFEVNRALDKEKIASYRQTNRLLSLIVCLVLLFAGIIVYYIRQRHINNIKDKVLLAEQLVEELEQRRQENSNNEVIVKSVLSTQYELLEQFTGILMETNDTRKARKKIADAVTDLIADLSIGGDKEKELEDRLDSLYDNVFTDFKLDLPNLKEADYRLFLFSALRMSNTTISVFLKEERIEAVYNRKRRLKDRIKQLDTSKSERYLSFL